MKNHKAQAAMEFLMTYGWAILVVVAAIGALAYFGVLNPDKTLPEKCFMPPGLACIDFKVAPTQTEIIIQNSGGFDMTIHSITIGNCTDSTEIELKNGEQNTFTLTCNNGDLGTKLKSDILLNYTKKGGLSKTATGSIVAKIQ